MNRRNVTAVTVRVHLASIHTRASFVSVPEVLVDSCTPYTWIPEDLLGSAGVRRAEKDLAFVGADGEILRRSIGYVIVRAARFQTVDEVVFAEPGDLVRLGARTLAGFGARVDARRACLIATGPRPVASMSG